VLLITVDTLRADALGCTGAAGDPTPRLDRLAAAGLRFDDAHAHSVLTLPSHASVLSGLLPPDHGIRANGGFRFPAGRDTLATLLKARGYATGAFVSAFPLDSRFGLARGFDVYDDAVGPREGAAFTEPERRGSDTVERARRWREAQRGPTFTWVHLYEPHFPYAPPAPLSARFAGNLYEGEVAAADAALGPLLDPILNGGSGRGTVVVMTADHGESLGAHGEASHGTFAYETTLKVPLIVYAPGLSPRVVGAPARHVDVLPTVLEAVGGTAPAGLPGRSLLARGPGPAAPADTYFEALGPQLDRGWAPLFGVIHEGMKYVDLPLPELYDLRADPGEARNLAAERPASLRALQQIVAPLERPAAERRTEEPETRALLRSLGYAAGGAPAAEHYGVDDDPKRLVALDALLEEAAARLQQGDKDGARRRFLEVLQRRPRMPVVLAQLALLEREAGRRPQAIAALARAVALKPDDAALRALLGSDLIQAGRAGEAAALLEGASAADEPDPDVVTTRAQALARLGRLDEARRLVQRARASDPTSTALLLHAGTLALMAGQRAEARAAFTEALAADGGLARAESALACMDAEDGDAGGALRRFTHAVALDPREWAAVPALGGLLWQRGRRDEARTYLTFFADGAPPAYAREVERVRRWLARPSAPAAGGPGE